MKRLTENTNNRIDDDLSSVLEEDASDEDDDLRNLSIINNNINRSSKIISLSLDNISTPIDSRAELRNIINIEANNENENGILIKPSATKTSSIWKHFMEYSINKTIAECIHCRKPVNIGNLIIYNVIKLKLNYI